MNLEKSLFKEGYSFDFYQAVKLLELFRPGKRSVAKGSEADKEAVRFSSNVSFEFPASSVSDIEPAETDEKPNKMTVNFMGLAGVAGPLPAPYSELILSRLKEKDFALKDFLDIFNHRLISLMYRVRKTFRIAFDGRSPDQTPFADYLFSWIGLGTRGLRNRMPIRDHALLFYTAILSQNPRSMSGLETILSHYFSVRVRGKQLCGGWCDLSEDQITSIGISGNNNILGQSAIIGRRIWDQQSRFELHIGPLDHKQIADFLPTGRAYEAMCQLVRFYVGNEFDYELVLMLRKGAFSGAGLSTIKGPVLGWTSWLSIGKIAYNHDDVRIRGV